MANYVNYKNIISKAITHFNNVQSALSTVGAKYGTSEITAPSITDAATLVPTDQFSGIITEQLQLKATGTLTITSSTTVDAANGYDLTNGKTTYKYVKLTAGKAQTPTTTITPNVLTGTWNGTTSKYVVSNTAKSQAITPTVTTGWITAGTAGNVTSAAVSLEIPKAVFTVSGASIKVTEAGAGYINAGATVGTIANAVVTNAKNHDITVTNDLSLVTDDGTAAGVNIAGNLLDLGDNNANVSTTEPTTGNYISFKASSTSNTATVSTTVGTAGYIATANKPGDITVSVGTQTAVTKYYKVKDATFEQDSTNGNIIKAKTAGYIAEGSTALTMAKASGWTIAGSTVTDVVTVGTKSGSNYPISAKIKGTMTAGTAGYIKGSTSTATATANSQVGTLPEAVFTVSGNKISASTAGYVPAGFTAGNVSAGSLTYKASLSCVLTDADDGKPGSSTGTGGAKINLFEDTKPTSGDYYTVTATGSGTLTAGYISSNPSNATAVKYIKKAKIEYVTDSTSGANFLQVTTGGFLPAGVIGDIADIGGTIDYATIDLGGKSITPTLDTTDNTYKITVTPTVTNAGYLDIDEGSTGHNHFSNLVYSMAKATISGGGLTGAGNNTLSSSDTTYLTDTDTGFKFTVAGTSKTITRAAVSVSNGYASGLSIASGTASVGTTSKTFNIKAGAISSSGSAAITANTTTNPTAAGGNAIIYATQTEAGASYVKVNGTYSTAGSVTTAGWVTSTGNKTSSGAASSGYLKASINPSVTGKASMTNNTTVTTFNDETGKINAAGGKTVTATPSISGVSNKGLKDTYVVGGLTVSGGSDASATINTGATGSDVDNAFESLFCRMLGNTYNEVTTD